MQHELLFAHKLYTYCTLFLHQLCSISMGLSKVNDYFYLTKIQYFTLQATPPRHINCKLRLHISR